MGTFVFVVVKDQSPELEQLARRVDGKPLSLAFETLDALSRESGVTPLMDLVSIDAESAADLLGDVDEAEEVEIPEESWFSPGAGLATVRSLLTRMKQDPAGVPHAALVLDDLAAMEALLVAAERAGTTFHLQIAV
jgi:hypothetical protein